jgi:hypothetical protein
VDSVSLPITRGYNLLSGLTNIGLYRNCTYAFDPDTGLIVRHTVDSIEPAPEERVYGMLFGLVGGGHGQHEHHGDSVQSQSEKENGPVSVLALVSVPVPVPVGAVYSAVTMRPPKQQQSLSECY